MFEPNDVSSGSNVCATLSSGSGLWRRHVHDDVVAGNNLRPVEGLQNDVELRRPGK
jgi:hypothetical protein